MFGISFPELLVILAVALIVFGPEKLPEIARTLGKMMGELRKGSDQLRREFYNSVYQPTQDLQRKINLSARELVAIPENEPGKDTEKPQDNLNCESDEKPDNK